MTSNKTYKELKLMRSNVESDLHMLAHPADSSSMLWSEAEEAERNYLNGLIALIDTQIKRYENIETLAGL